MEMKGRGFELAMSVSRDALMAAIRKPDVDYVEIWIRGKYFKTYHHKGYAARFFQFIPKDAATCKIFLKGRKTL